MLMIEMMNWMRHKSQPILLACKLSRRKSQSLSHSQNLMKLMTEMKKVHLMKSKHLKLMMIEMVMSRSL